MRASWIFLMLIFLDGETSSGDVGGGVENDLTNGSLLFKIQSVSKKGRLLNHSVEDWKFLDPTCPCAMEADPGACDLECCYCHLECPVVQNSFSQAAMFPPVSCPAKENDDVARGLQQEVRREIFPWICGDHLRTTKSRLAKMFCIQYTNLKSSKIYYRMNVGWTGMIQEESDENREVESKPSQAEDGHFKDEEWSWKTAAGNNLKDHSSTTQKCKYTFDFSELSCPAPQKRSETEPTEEAVERIEINTGITGIVWVNEVNFTKNTDPRDGLSIIEVFATPKFSFSAQPLCTEFTAGMSLDECEYSINTSSLRDCDQVLNAVKMTTKVVTYLLTARKSPVTFLGIDEGLKNSNSKECIGTPTGGIITEVFARETFVGAYSNFTEFSSGGAVLGSLSLSYTRMYVSDKDLHKLPRFWEDFFYGKCTTPTCWINFAQVGPPEAWRMSNIDYAFLRQVAVFIIMILPIMISLYLRDASN